MYISGDSFDFEVRQHEFPTTTGDLITGFYPEGTGYTGISQEVLYKWDREYNLKFYSFSSSGITGTFI